MRTSTVSGSAAPLDGRPAPARGSRAGRRLAIGLGGWLAWAACGPATAGRGDSAAEPAPAVAASAAARRTLLLLEDRCLAESGPPCDTAAGLGEAAAALAERVHGEGRDLLRSPSAVRNAVHRAGIGHPHVLAAALIYSGPEPAVADLAAFVSGIAWPFAARSFGVADLPGGGDDGARGVLLVVGAAPLVSMNPLPRWLPQPASLAFEGRLSAGLSQLQVLLSDPSGAVRSRPVEVDADGRFRASVPVGPDRGRYVFELLAEDRTAGPQVVFLLPIELSPTPPEAPPDAPAEGAGTRDVDAAAAWLVERIAVFRESQGLPPMAHDDRLASEARRHAEDMAAHGFFGHVSPTRGGLEDRLRAEGLRLERAAENLAMGPTAEAAFDNLLESPAHRANFLDAGFDRFGVAAAPSGESLYFAVVFGSVR